MVLVENQVWKFVLQNVDGEVSYDQVIQLWQHDSKFNGWLIDQILTCPCRAIRWETPPVTLKNVGRPFEFVVVNSPGLDRPESPAAFSKQFQSCQEEPVIAFSNLGRNAMMVVPTPKNPSANYCHLQSFLQTADREQAIELWKIVGREMENRLGDSPVWLSTAGGGVAWLHVRLDDRPKYYSHRNYREEKV